MTGPGRLPHLPVHVADRVPDQAPDDRLVRQGEVPGARHVLAEAAKLEMDGNLSTPLLEPS